MMSPGQLVRLAWPDVLERVRRSGYLLTLATTLWLGSLVYTNNIQLRMQHFRGEVNSAWLGTVMALTAASFVSLAGFYIVKNSIERDRQTGVGQILAATPISTRAYLLAKWLSNFAVLASIVLTLAVSALGLHVLQAEAIRLDLVALLSPLALLALPAMAVVAAFAVLFESVRPLSGGAGNAAYFFVWGASLVVPVIAKIPWLDWSGISFVERSLAAAVAAREPGTTLTMSFSAGPARDLSHLAPLHWTGIDWTMADVAMRVALVGVSVLVVLGAAVWFDRFDAQSTGGGANRTRAPQATARTSRRSAGRWLAHAVPLWSWLERVVSTRSRFGAMVFAELRLAFCGLSAWWMLVAAALWIVSLTTPMEVARYAHVAAWAWPLLMWSKMGMRETLYRTGPLVFSCPRSLQRQFTALWVSGALIAVVTGSGIAVRFALAGDQVSLGAWLSGALFIPSLALALGVWTGSARAFEAIYTAWWYLGPANRVVALDYSGAWAASAQGPSVPVYAALAVLLMAAAVVGRRKMIRQ
ncbi:MAG: hypothetical protein WCP29_11200 [Acidobacteriota bacterium]